jgi:hypothetical protein
VNDQLASRPPEVLAHPGVLMKSVQLEVCVQYWKQSRSLPKDPASHVWWMCGTGTWNLDDERLVSQYHSFSLARGRSSGRVGLICFIAPSTPRRALSTKAQARSDIAVPKTVCPYVSCRLSSSSTKAPQVLFVEEADFLCPFSMATAESVGILAGML